MRYVSNDLLPCWFPCFTQVALYMPKNTQIHRFEIITLQCFEYRVSTDRFDAMRIPPRMPHLELWYSIFIELFLQFSSDISAIIRITPRVENRRTLLQMRTIQAINLRTPARSCLDGIASLHANAHRFSAHYYSTAPDALGNACAARQHMQCGIPNELE